MHLKIKNGFAKAWRINKHPYQLRISIVGRQPEIDFEVSKLAIEPQVEVFIPLVANAFGLSRSCAHRAGA